MSSYSQINNHINRLKTNKIFTADTFTSDTISKNAARMVLERMVSEGNIRKLDRGRYYKPEQSMFGETALSIEQMIADLLISKTHQPIGYLTGTICFANMGLTTQISSHIQIGVRKYRRSIRRGDYTISFVLQPNAITKDNIYLLQLLDAIRFVREIPASTPDEIVSRLKYLIGKLSARQQLRIVSLALQYTQYVRALLGAIMEDSGSGEELTKPLQTSLNELTYYKLPISNQILPTLTNWNIK